MIQINTPYADFLKALEFNKTRIRRTARDIGEYDFYIIGKTFNLNGTTEFFQLDQEDIEYLRKKAEKLNDQELKKAIDKVNDYYRSL